MSARKIIAVVAALCVAALVAWSMFRATVPSPADNVSGSAGVHVPILPPDSGIVTPFPTPLVTTSPPAAPSRSFTATAGPTVPSSPQSSPAAATSPPIDPAASASTDAIKVRRMVTDYHTLHGENPVGTNAEIMAAIMGKNPHQAVLGPPEGIGLNARGELVDEWGTPYFFHQLSKDVMEIHSAGPDKIMGTADDIVVR